MARAMAAAASTALPPCSPGCSLARPSAVSCSALVIPRLRCPRIQFVFSVSPEGSRRLCPWSGLKNLGITCRYRKRGGKERYMGRVYASLFGVGAPEALVIGVVALLVFGPKGLAEVARNLGKTLRAFQPTIRELQDVSREFKDTLEREIGLDEIPRYQRNSTYQSSLYTNKDPQPTVDPNGSPSTSRPYTNDKEVNLTGEQLVASPVQETASEDHQVSTSTSESVTKSTSAESASSVSASDIPSQTAVQNSENEGSKS